MNVRAHLIISGRVQGVCYRAFAKDEAGARKLRGWVRNLPTGQVEVVFEGKKDQVDGMIQWCHRGPTGAKVTQVEVNWEDTQSEFDDFRIINRT